VHIVTKICASFDYYYYYYGWSLRSSTLIVLVVTVVVVVVVKIVGLVVLVTDFLKAWQVTMDANRIRVASKL